MSIIEDLRARCVSPLDALIELHERNLLRICSGKGYAILFISEPGTKGDTMLLMIKWKLEATDTILITPRIITEISKTRSTYLEVERSVYTNKGEWQYELDYKLKISIGKDLLFKSLSIRDSSIAVNTEFIPDYQSHVKELQKLAKADTIIEKLNNLSSRIFDPYNRRYNQEEFLCKGCDDCMKPGSEFYGWREKMKR